MHFHHHSHDHPCDHNHHHSESHEGNKKGLFIAFVITAGIMFLELFGGIFTNSLALLSDSGHMLSDSSSLALSLFAIWMATKPVNSKKTFGNYRFEILAALFNGITLLIISIFIIHEAWERIIHPSEVSSFSMIIIASIGLFANLLSAWALMKKGDVEHNINVRSAYLHIIGDALGSLGAIIAGGVMYFTSFYIADPIISVIVALIILKGAWGITKQSIHILMEGVPHYIEKEQVEQQIKSIQGILEIHDLHIWTITSGLDSLSCHLLIEDHLDSQDILQKVIDCIEKHFHIAHSTIQIEKSYLKHTPMRI